MNADMSVVLFMTLAILASISMASERESGVEVMSVVLFMALLILFFKSMGAEPEPVVGASA